MIFYSFHNLFYFLSLFYSLTIHFSCWQKNIYFELRFVLANAINTYLRMKNCVMCVGNFHLRCLLIEFVMGPIYLYVSEIFKTFKTGFRLQKWHSKMLFWSLKSSVKCPLLKYSGEKVLFLVSTVCSFWSFFHSLFLSFYISPFLFSIFISFLYISLPLFFN